MTWLAVQLWPFLALAAVLGALVTVVLMTTRVSVERWERNDAQPAVRPFPVLADVAAAAAPQADAADRRAARSSSPFPPLAGHDPDDRPWEAEELWSRPARLAVSAGQRRTSNDEWSEAAENWRTWADEATGRAYVDTGASATDDDLFAADREAERLGHARAPLFPGSPRQVAADGFDGGLDDEDDFPFARPVEANG